jgi:hypothetical protein
MNRIVVLLGYGFWLSGRPRQIPGSTYQVEWAAAKSTMEKSILEVFVFVLSKTRRKKGTSGDSAPLA